jgi:DNA-binding HxlR family transcriptional regulator
MSENSNDGRTQLICLCPLEGVIDIISKKWALLIINEIGNHGRIRYKELQKELGDMGPNTLAGTLKGLQIEELIIRENFNEFPPRVEYALTKEGTKLRQAILPLLRCAISKKGTVVAHCSCSRLEKGKILK